MKCPTAVPLILTIAALLLALPGGASAGRILVGYAPDIKSHLRSILPFAQALVEAGHDVSVFYVYSNSSGALENLGPGVEPIMLELPNSFDSHMSDVGKMVWTETLHGYRLPVFYHHLGSFSIDAIAASPLFTEALNTDWDFMLVSELFAMHAYALASALRERRNVPYAVFASSQFTSGDSYRLAFAQNWVAEKGMITPPPRDNHDLYSPRDFHARLVNVVEQASENLAMVVVDWLFLSPAVTRLTGRTDFSLAALLQDGALYFSDSIASFGPPIPTVPEMFNVGAHCEQAKPLDQEYASFVEDPHSLGTIYIAFGTVIPWDSAPQWAKDTIFSALEQLSDYRIIFAYKGTFPTRRLPPHIRLVKWAPQLDILAHRNTRVFLTHSGLKSVKEALCTATPMLVMPMFAEQNHNAKAVLGWGIGNVLNKFHLTADGIVATLREVLGNGAYGARVRQLRAIFLDRPMSAMAEGATHVTRLIAKQREAGEKARHETQQGSLNAPAPVPRLFFGRQGMHLSLCHYWNLDVLGVVVLGLLLFVRK